MEIITTQIKKDVQEALEAALGTHQKSFTHSGKNKVPVENTTPEWVFKCRSVLDQIKYL